MRLQVGDIRMDTERGVSFASSTDGPAIVEDSASLVHRVANAPRWAYGLVALGSGCATLAILAASLLTQLWFGLIPALLFARLSSYACILAVTPLPRPAPTLTVADAAILLRAFRVTESSNVEHLLGATGWSERRLLAGLTALIVRGEVEEDLDVETGRWHYRRTTEFSGLEHRKTLSAEDRLRAVENQHTQGVSR